MVFSFKINLIYELFFLILVIFVILFFFLNWFAKTSSKKISKIVKACVINAGDGSHEHPTQALLDALTIKRKFNSFHTLKIAICGDILHSRVARSNIEILSTLGATINVIGPQSLIPKGRG